MELALSMEAAAAANMASMLAPPLAAQSSVATPLVTPLTQVISTPTTISAPPMLVSQQQSQATQQQPINGEQKDEAITPTKEATPTEAANATPSGDNAAHTPVLTVKDHSTPSPTHQPPSMSSPPPNMVGRAGLLASGHALQTAVAPPTAAAAGMCDEKTVEYLRDLIAEKQSLEHQLGVAQMGMGGVGAQKGVVFKLLEQGRKNIC